MGFKNGAWATVWSVEPSPSGASTKVRISTNKKKDGEYEQDFGEYCLFIGQAHKDAVKLQVKDRIRLGDCEVESRYDKEKKVKYTTFKVYGFEISDSPYTNEAQNTSTQQSKKTAFDEIPMVSDNTIENAPF